MYLDRESLQELRRMISEDLDTKIKAIVERRMDGMQEQLNKLEKIDRIIADIKSLFE